MQKRYFWGLVLGVTFFALCSTIGLAQEKYPSRQVEMVVPYSAGGTTSLLARMYCDELTKDFKVPVVVVNRPGGGGIVGATFVSRAKNDGYTLLQGMGDTHTLGPVTNPDVSYDPLKDFTPIAGIASMPLVFTVPNNSPLKTFAEMIDYARKNPGKLRMGATGLGGEAHLNLAIIGTKEKIDIVVVPFDGGAPYTAAILGGHVDMAAGQLSPKSQVGPHILAKALRGLAVTSKTRHPDFPDIPTMTELGYPDANINNWYAIFGPAGVPQSVVNTLFPAIQKVIKDPAIASQMRQGGFLVDLKNQDELRSFVETELKVLGKLCKDLGLAAKK